MIQVRSTFDGTPIVPARTAGVFTVDAGSPVTMTALQTHPSATYEWDLGDGTTAIGPSVTHSYADSGVYVAVLTVVVNEPGGARTRYFAKVEARNVPPTVTAGSDITVDEGDVVPFTGTFSDPQWPDTHEATWSWGDYQGPSAGHVVEAIQPPTGGGTVEGSHAWGDNGTYTVTLTVRDDDGGVGEDTLQVTVINVPPVVDAGPELFAYPCSVITLVGHFTDPGWLDTHEASWQFGDCGPPHTAIVEETHEPPAGTGTATASHIYERCGDYHAVCTVVDDDGGIGTDATVIRVVTVANAGFEDGFHPRTPGAIANSWQLYADPKDADAGGDAVTFRGEEILVHSGQRAQRITVRQGQRAGILQQIGANPGWGYQVSAWYTLDERENGTARLGLDPAGGTDPDAPGVAWTEGSDHREWAQLVARVSAVDRRITIFLEADARDRNTDAYFDDVALVPIQPFCPVPPSPPEADPRCADFTAYGPRAQLPSEFEEQGFGFASVDGATQTVVPWLAPQGIPKLAFHRTGVDVRLPFRAGRVTIDAVEATGTPIHITAYDALGAQIATTSKPPYELLGRGIARVRVEGGGNEAAIIRICAEPEERKL